MDLQQFPGYTLELYTWAHLPYAIPGIISLLVGSLFSAIFFSAGKKNAKRKQEFRGLAIAFLGYGMIIAVISLRSLISDKILLMKMHNLLNPVAWVFPLGTAEFLFYFLNKENRIVKYIRYLAWAVLIIVIGTALTIGTVIDKWFILSFGNYPVASKPMKLATALVILPALYCSYSFFKDAILNPDKSRRFISIPFGLMILLLNSNAPSLLGFNFIPLGIFCFIPMLAIAYGVYRSDFSSLNELLFQRSVFFYATMGTLAILFAIIFTVVSANISIESVDITIFYPWSVVYVINVLIIFFLAILIGGSDASNKKNQLTSLYLILLGFLLISHLAGSLYLNPVIFMRIDQVCYMFFVFFPAVGLRTLFAYWNIKRPRYMIVIDALAVIFCLLNFSTFFRDGYYSYYYGMYTASGPGSKLFSAYGGGVFIIAIYYFIRFYRNEKSDKKSNLIVLSFMVAGLIILSGIPSLNGIESIPASFLQIIPALMLTYAISRYNSLGIKNQAARVHRWLYSLIIVIMLFGSFLLYNIHSSYPIPRLVAYILIVITPLFIFSLVAVFTITKPITSQIDQNYHELTKAKKSVDKILHNILPHKIALELQGNNQVKPEYFELISLMFVDFKNFTAIASKLSPEELIKELDGFFNQFDGICSKNNLEKIKTIGDAYMCAGGLPERNNTHTLDICLGALSIMEFTRNILKLRGPGDGVEEWRIRIGIHTGPVIAGVIGKHKFSYDIWGDAVNVASRLESTGIEDNINISEALYEKVKYFFVTSFRGSIEAKGKGKIDMYFLDRLKPKYSQDADGYFPNKKFMAIYDKIKNGARVISKDTKPI